jgi:anti-sigma factor RsiW
MTMESCDRLSAADLVDYAAGDLDEHDAAVLEEHLFSCPACGRRAGGVDALAAGVVAAMRRSRVHGLVNEAVLNRLSRDGVRVRSYALSPGDVVPCAVWDDDELMVLRLRADFAGVREVTLVQRLAGAGEVSRASGLPSVDSRGEILYAEPAELVRRLPACELDVVLTADVAGAERTIASYTLRHEGSLRRAVSDQS